LSESENIPLDGVDGTAFAKGTSIAGSMNLVFVRVNEGRFVVFGDNEGDEPWSVWAINNSGPVPCSEALPQRKKDVNLLLGDFGLLVSSIRSWSWSVSSGNDILGWITVAMLEADTLRECVGDWAVLRDMFKLMNLA